MNETPWGFENYTIVTYAISFVLMFAFFTAGCTLSPDVEGIIDKSGKSIGTVIVANAADTLANTREIKAKTVSSIKTDKLKADTMIALAKNNRYKGWMEGILSILILIFLVFVVRYFYPKPKSVKTDY